MAGKYNAEKIENSAQWRTLFESKGREEDRLPWDEEYELSPDERRCIASSVQQFELGENSAGRTLLRMAGIYAAKSGDPEYPDAVKAFICEEQRHSSIIRRFMRKHSIPCLTKHWVDGVFRKMRKLAGLELSVMVLVSAEIIACPYYRALGNATKSVLLNRICRKILTDERHHLYFQAQILMKLRKDSWRYTDRLKNLLHAVLLFGACMVVWRYHRSVFVSGGVTLSSFLRSSFLRMGFVLRRANPCRQKEQAAVLIGPELKNA